MAECKGSAAGMTDEQIIEVVDRCIAIGEDCENCPFRDYKVCSDKLRECFHDLIKSKNAEIEKLERTVSHLEDYANGIADKVRTEAIKEFAERLKAGSIWVDLVSLTRIDNILKEMVGDKK